MYCRLNNWTFSHYPLETSLCARQWYISRADNNRYTKFENSCSKKRERARESNTNTKEKKREREKRGEQITLDGTRANGQNESQTINSLWQPNIDIEAVIPLSFFSDFLTWIVLSYRRRWENSITAKSSCFTFQKGWIRANTSETKIQLNDNERCSLPGNMSRSRNIFRNPIETLGRGTVWCQMLPRILDKSSLVRGENNFTRPASPATISSTLFSFGLPSQPRNAFSLGVTSRKKLTIAPSLLLLWISSTCRVSL